MESETAVLPVTLPENGVDDGFVALALQLEDIRNDVAFDKGKYPEGQPPDTARALLEYRTELETCLQTLTDLKLAHSIAQAVATDGPVIAQLLGVEIQAEEDRKIAIQISTDIPELESAAAPPPYEENEPTRSFMSKQKQHADDPQWGTSSIYKDDWDSNASDNEEHEGPLALKDPQASSYIKRQQAALKILGSPECECCGCSEVFRPGEVFRLACDDVFCRACLTRFIKLAMGDKTRFPPRCHRQAISRDLVHSLLSEQDMEDFSNIEIEISCAVKTYCSDPSCGRFIPPDQIIADRAYCTRCGSSTCTNCNNKFHDNDCPEDPLLQATLALAADQKWQRCFSCRAVVILAKACNHITCRCGTEFCYVCGSKWKSCVCDAWDEENIINRAGELVDREAIHPLQPQERQFRVEAMRQELLQTHECAHSGRFQRIFDGPRRGFRCEMCEARHRKYILQCRHCHLRACEDCRRHRI